MFYQNGTSEQPDSSNYCYFCNQKIYLSQQQECENHFFHRKCFVCKHCQQPLNSFNHYYHKPTGYYSFVSSVVVYTRSFQLFQMLCNMHSRSLKTKFWIYLCTLDYQVYTCFYFYKNCFYFNLCTCIKYIKTPLELSNIA